MRSLSCGCSPAWPCTAGLPARVGAADWAIVKSIHRSSSWEARNPGSCENSSWPRLAAPSGDAKAGSWFESEGVYPGAWLWCGQSVSIAVQLKRREPGGGPSSKSGELSEAGEKCGEAQIGKSLNAVNLHLLLLLLLLLSTLYYNTTVHSYNCIRISEVTANGHAARGIRWHVDHSDPSEPITPATAPCNPVALPCKGAPSRNLLISTASVPDLTSH